MMWLDTRAFLSLRLIKTSLKHEICMSKRECLICFPGNGLKSLI
jgi:hypothetical protein